MSQEPQPRPGGLPRRGGYAPADSQACPQLELRGIGARSACQSRLSQLYPRGRREGPGRQNHGALGHCSRAASHQAGSRKNGENRARKRSDGRAQNARGYHVVETNVHYPTDSSLLGDGVRVLTRTMKKITKIAGEVGAKLRDRSRSVKLRVLDIARAARSKAKQSQEKLKRAYGQLLNSTSRVVGQAKRFSAETRAGAKRSTDLLEQLVLDKLRHELDAMVPLVRQVMKQTRARIFRGDTRSEGKLLSLFEPTTEVIRKGKAGKPNEFGKMVKLQEAENQIVTDYEVYDHRPSDSDLLIGAVETHQAMLGRIPHLVAADAGFYSAKNEVAAKAKGVKRVCIPNRSTKSPERKREQKKRWFRNGQKWRTGCEGRISVVKRRHGLNRCRYKGEAGMKRWVGLGVIADNVINIGRAMEKQVAP